MIQESTGDKEFIELVDRLVRPGVSEISRWAKVVIAINTSMDIYEYKEKIYYMSLGAKLLFGELAEFDLEYYNSSEYIEQAYKFLGMIEGSCINNTDLNKIAQYIRTYNKKESSK